MRLYFLFFFYLFFVNLFAQDVIVKTNGERLQVTDIQYTDSTISFRYYAAPNGNYFLLNLREVVEVRYSDGRVAVFDARNSNKPNNNENANLFGGDMYQKAIRDASIFYHGYVTPMILTGVSAAACGPVCGLVPAFFTTKTPPKSHNLGYPNPELMNNRPYVDAYISRSWQIKRNKVWLGYGIGVGISLAGTFLFYSLK